MPPRAAPHSYVGTGAEGTAQAAGGCPHHLRQDREQALSMTACPGVPQPGSQRRASSHQGIATRLPEFLQLDAVPSRAALCHPPEGDFSLSFWPQPVLPCKGQPCQARINEQQSLGHFSRSPKLIPKPHSAACQQLTLYIER